MAFEIDHPASQSSFSQILLASKISKIISDVQQWGTMERIKIGYKVF